jgi:hypothetical protein
MSRRRGALARLAMALALGWAASPEPARAQEVRVNAGGRIEDLRALLRSRSGGVLGLMGYNVTPDGSANAIQVNRSSSGDESSPSLLLSQFGFGFTVSESFPLFLEAYVGAARYDPRALFTGEGARRLPLRWNNVAGTVGIGYDIALAENLWLRPIVNFSLGYAASDASLFGAFIERRRDVDISQLTDAHMNVWGYGGSLVLAYYDYRPERDIDLELRYTHIQLQTFGDTFPAAEGSSTAQTLGLWARYRWPTGREAFGRPIRWVLDGTATTYLGDQQEAIGFSWSAKIGGGIEFDIGRREIGAMGLSLSRLRLIGRYFIGDNNVTGYSFGLGISF